MTGGPKYRAVKSHLFENRVVVRNFVNVDRMIVDQPEQFRNGLSKGHEPLCHLTLKRPCWGH